MSSSVLVTGGTGFIGAYVIRELVQNNYRVRATMRKGNRPFFIPQHITDKVEWVHADILDVPELAGAMENIDAVIHCAALVSFHRPDRKEMYNVNIDGTANVVNLALERNISRLVHVSSVAALGRTMNGEIVNEEKQWEQNKYTTGYSISKYHGEMEVWRAIAEGLNAVIVNPSTVLGFGNWNTSSCALFKSAYGEFPWYTEGVNGFVDVTDVAKAIVSLMQSSVTNERYILTGENRTFLSLFSSMADAFHKKKPSKKGTPLLTAFALEFEKIRAYLRGRRPLLTKESARIAYSRTYFDNRKILETLPGFAFRPVEDSIQQACEKYLLSMEKGELAK